jgi:hypothetical protein
MLVHMKSMFLPLLAYVKTHASFKLCGKLCHVTFIYALNTTSCQHGVYPVKEAESHCHLRNRLSQYSSLDVMPPIVSVLPLLHVAGSVNGSCPYAHVSSCHQFTNYYRVSVNLPYSLRVCYYYGLL